MHTIPPGCLLWMGVSIRLRVRVKVWLDTPSSNGSSLICRHVAFEMTMPVAAASGWGWSEDWGWARIRIIVEVGP